MPRFIKPSVHITIFNIVIVCETKLFLVELTDFHSIRQGHGSSVMDESDVENRSHCRLIETWKGLASMCGMHLAGGYYPGGSNYCDITNVPNTNGRYRP